MYTQVIIYNKVFEEILKAKTNSLKKYKLYNRL